MKFPIRSIILSATVFLACQQSAKLHHVERNGFLMDTVIRISIYDTRSEDAMNGFVDELFHYMLKIEKEVSIHWHNSDPERLQNAGGDGQFISIRPHTEVLLKQSRSIFQTTHGAFDVTIGPLKTLWGFDSGAYRVPDSSEIQAYLDLGDFRNVELKDGQARITVPGLGIDLGGIAKGYILDQAVQWLEERGVRAGLVEAGGDLRVFGPHPERDTWRIGIQDPRAERGRLIGSIAVNNQSVATSGDYERYFVRDGKRYHHILDPKTGFPADGAVSVTIVAPEALQADAYATAAFVMGPDAGIAMLNSLPFIEGLIVCQIQDSLVYALTRGAEPYFNLE